METTATISSTRKETNISYGQAARVENTLDANKAFSRAYSQFVSLYGREPEWATTTMRMDVTLSSVRCVIREEREVLTP